MTASQKNTAPTPPRSLAGSAMVPRRYLAGWSIAEKLAAAADRGAVEAHVAAAAFLTAAGQGVAAGLQDTAASFVTADTGDAATVLGVLALGNAAGEVALANHHPVDRAAARAHAVGQHLTKILEGGARDIVIATAVDLEAAFALLELDVAPGHDTPVLSRRYASGPNRGSRNVTRQHTTIHHDSTGHQNNSFGLVDASGPSSRQLRCLEDMASPSWGGQLRKVCDSTARA